MLSKLNEFISIYKSPAMIFDKNETLLACNDGCKELMGCKGDGCRSRVFTDVFPQTPMKRVLDGETSLNALTTCNRMIEISQQIHPIEFEGQEYYFVLVEEKHAIDMSKLEGLADSTYKQLFLKSGDPYFILKGSIFVDCNQQTLEILKMTRQELLGLHPWDVSPEYQNDGSLSTEKAQVMIKEAEISGFHKFEWTHQDAHGGIICAEVVLTVIVSDGLDSIYFVTWRDRTLRKHIEEENSRLSNRLKLATHIGNIGTWTWKPKNNEFEWDENMRAIFEVDNKGENLISSWQEKVMDEDYEKLVFEMQTALEESRDFEVDYRIKLDGGKIKHLTTLGRPFFDITTREQMVLGILLDNSKHFQMLEELKEREMLLKTATNNAKIGMWDWHIKEDCFSFNDEWASMCGYEVEELSTSSFQTWEKLTHPDDLNRSKELLDEHLTGVNDIYECETRIKHKNGSWIWVLDRGKVVEWNEDYEPIRMVGTHTEITKMKEAKLALVEARKKAEHAAKLSNEANEAKSSYLANISHEIRTPLNGMLGFLDILKQTPLNSDQESYLHQAESATEILLKLVNDLLDYSKLEVSKIELDNQPFSIRQTVEETLRFFNVKAYEKSIQLYSYIDPKLPFKVLGDGIRLKQIITNLISNSIKFTHDGEVYLGIEVINQGEQVEVSISVKDTGIGMSEETLKDLYSPFVQADSHISSKYGGTGLGLSISKKLIDLMGGKIDVTSQLGLGTEITIHVHYDVLELTHPKMDTYDGLKDAKILIISNQEKQVDVFKKYLLNHTEHVAVLDPDDIVEEAIENYEHIIVQGFAFKKLYKLLKTVHDIKSSDGRTLLWLSNEDKSKFPDQLMDYVDGTIVNPINYYDLLDELNNIDKKHDITVEKAESTDLSMMYRPKILIAEDNEINQKLLTSYLKRRGLTCDVVCNGLEAYHAFEEMAYDLVLMDCQMPVMDGYTSTIKIRELENSQHTQIIALTAHADREDEIKCLNAGMNHYLSKPVQFPKLDLLIKACTNSLIGRKDKLVIYDNAVARLMNKTTLSKEAIENLVVEFIDSAQEQCIEMRELCLDVAFDDLYALVHEVRSTSNNLHIYEMAEKMDELLDCISDEDQEGCMNAVKMMGQLLGLN